MKITSETLVRAFREFLNEETETENSKKPFYIRDLLEKLKKYEDYSWIVFDTETTGLDPHDRQLTEVAGLSINFNSQTGKFNISNEEFNYKCALTDETEEQIKDQEKKEKDPKDMTIQQILDMNQYNEKTVDVLSEEDCIKKFIKFIDEHKNPLLVIQNARFDREFLSVRAARYGIRVDKYPSLDTHELLNEFFYPLLLVNDELSILPAITKKGVDKKGRPYESVSFSQGVIAKALKIDTSKWHSAIADVKMLLGITERVIEQLNKHKDLEIREAYEKAIKRARDLLLKRQNLDQMKRMKKYRTLTRSERRGKRFAVKQMGINQWLTQAGERFGKPEASSDEIRESKLSKYWQKRANLKAERANRKKGNKQDKDWAKGQQDLSSKLNEKVFKLFEKELSNTNETSDEVTAFLKKMKREKRRKKLKMLEKKKANAIPPLENPKNHKKKKAKNPYAGEKKAGKKYPYEGSRNGFLKTLNKRIKKAGGYALPMGAAYGGGSAAMEEGKKVAQPKKVVKSEKKDENK